MKKPLPREGFYRGGPRREEVFGKL